MSRKVIGDFDMFTISDDAKKAFFESLDDMERQNLELVKQVLDKLAAAMLDIKGEEATSTDAVRGLVALFMEID